MVARGNGLDIMFLAASTRIRSNPPDNSGLLVRTPDSIRTAKDLAGKKISAGLINSVNYAHMREWMQRNGADPSSVQFLEIPFPQMADALFQNRLDAVWNVEPFLTFMVRSGNARVIAYPYQENVPRMDITCYLAKESWLKANPDVARRFKRAIERATTDLINATKEVRDDWVAKYTGARPEVVAAMNLPEFTTEFNIPSLKANLDIAVRQKLAKPFDLDTMIWKP
jgi:NitT/TauT family transport system substrate-binding protein